MLSKKNKFENRIQELENKLASFQTAVTELKVLNEIAVAAGKAENVEQTLELILNKTLSFINAEHGAIFLVSERNEVLETFIKLARNSKLNKKTHIGEHITGWVLAKKAPLIIKDLSEDKRFKTTDEERKIIKSLICSPIWFEGKIIGILQMINKKKEQERKPFFTDYDLSLISIISAQAGQIIENSKLQQVNFEKKKEAEIAKLETEKLQELDRLKTNFFTNLSHEFRTPLTLILGPAEKINSNTSNDVTKDSGIIKRNSQRLLKLVNQLLDLSGLEAGKMKLEASKNNIVSFVKGVVLSFESLSEEKDIALKISSEKEIIELYFDKEKMIKILTNILSNAFKYTKEDGKITVSITESSSLPGEALAKPGSSVEIKIRDTGIGIPKEEIPKLFDRFYQVDSSFKKENEGTGIGLALTKELVELHHGSISVESEMGTWTEFTLKFPAGREHLKDEEMSNNEEEDRSKTTVSEENYFMTKEAEEIISENIEIDLVENDKMIILIVEDNYDMREYIKESLGEDYRIEEAINGEQGVRKAEKIIPDLIISDMMMPKMDGNEMTRILRNNEKTSHIPIIILTAKTGQESKLEGLETGADDYLTKPFDIKELQIRIANLINIRRRLQEKYSKGEFVLEHTENFSRQTQTGKEKLRNIDQKFIDKVIKIINEHISDEGFSIEQLGSEVGMSRSQVHRKIRALTGLPPNAHVRKIRLSKAKEMIKNGEGNISEISYSVGFSSPVYFSKCFKEEFGYPPKNLTG
jgi:signal transduction histidine kinase/DNA-binding response OmpR family regulator